MPNFSRFARSLSPATQALLGYFYSTVHGEARFMKKSELKAFLSPQNKGLILSPKYRLSLEDSFKNLGLIAPTGSGKTSRFVIPNILGLEGSAIVTDPSGEIFQKTSGHLADHGFQIRTIKPTDLKNSFRFNPLQRIKTLTELRQMAANLCLNVQAEKSDPFWVIGATSIIYISLAALKNERVKEQFRNLANLRWLINNLSGFHKKAVLDFMAANLDKIMFTEFLAFISGHEKLVDSFLSTARAALDLWSDPDIQILTASDNISLERFREEKTIIYLIVPEHQIPYFSILLNLFYSACFEYCLSPAKAGENFLPVFFFLDEFGNLGRINNFPAIATTLRKRRCSLNIVLQDISQIEALYGKHDAQTIFSGGMGNKLFFAGHDLETASYLEQTLGQTTEYDSVFGGVDSKAKPVNRPLMFADEIRMLGEREGILISGRELPIKVEMPPYFANPFLKRLTEKKPCPLKLNYGMEKVEFLEFQKKVNRELKENGQVDGLRQEIRERVKNVS